MNGRAEEGARPEEGPDGPATPIGPDSPAGPIGSRPRPSGGMVVVGVGTPLAMLATMLPWWAAPWLFMAADAALPVVPVVVGLWFGRGGARWRQVGVGLLALAALLAGMWFTRNSDFGIGYALMLAVPVLPIVIGVPTALERRLPAAARGYGLGLALGGTVVLSLLLVVAYPPTIVAVGVAAVLTTATLARGRPPRVSVVRTPRTRSRPD